MTAGPCGRGGRPLQNLIARGIRETVVSALRMTSEMEAGPVSAPRRLWVERSTAEEIYLRAAEISFDIIDEMVRRRPFRPQTGEVPLFHHRHPAESEVPQVATLLRTRSAP